MTSTDTSESLRLLLEATVRLTGAAGAALWSGDPAATDAMAKLVCAVGSTCLGRNRFTADGERAGRERWTAAERRKRISSTPAIVAGKTAGVLTIFHPESPPSEDAELILVLVAARAGSILVSGEGRERLAARDEFLSLAAHQWRTPMAILQLELQGLERALRRLNRDDARLAHVQQVLARATGQCDRVQKIGEHLLDLLELRTPRLCLNRAPADLAELAEAVASRLANELTHAQCTLCLDVQRGAVGDWDRARLEQVVHALLLNAAKHAPGSHVEVVVDANATTATLKVRDDGMGIPTEDLPHIFDRFGQVGSREPVGGWGYGLFVCRRIVEAHSGTIRVTSAPGRGSTFTVELPRGAPLDLRALRAPQPHPN